MPLFDTLAEGARGIKSGFNTVSSLFNGSGPKTTNNMADGIADLLHYDVGRTAYFKVVINRNSKWGVDSAGAPSMAQNNVVPWAPGMAPPEITIGKFSDEQSLSFLCHTAELPGESTATIGQKIYGITEKFSVMTGYNDITLAFYTRGSGVEISRKYFQDWLAFMTGRFETVNYKGKQTVETTYNVQYKDYYTSTIKITHYAITGDPLVEVTLYDAFPVSINQVPLSWSSQNQAQSLNVTFAYTEYSYAFFEVEGSAAYSRAPLGELLGTALKTASTINTIKSTFKGGNPLAATSVLPGLSDFSMTSKK